VVLYDYGIGAEFDRLMNRSKRNGKFKVIQGGFGKIPCETDFSLNTFL
jgi:hypothetical protein